MTRLVVGISLPKPLHDHYLYTCREEDRARLKWGTPVRLHFGKKETLGYVVDEPAYLDKELDYEIKPILEIYSAPFDAFASLQKTAQFVIDYYRNPPGEVLHAFYQNLLPIEEKPPRKKKATALDVAPAPAWQLSPEQKKIEGEINRYFSQAPAPPSSAFVLQGVTGSGKTEIYLSLCQQAIAEDKAVLILVPEIALSQQLLERIQLRLGIRAVAWHSAMTPAQKKDARDTILRGNAKILVGARSALFLPIPKLSLIIIDEEHDTSFKQEERMRYHARDVALVRARSEGLSVILGSATPSIEAQELVQKKGAGYALLQSRFNAAQMPELEWVDLKKAPLIPGFQTPFSEVALRALEQCVKDGEQALLFLNRKGFSAALLCQACAHVPTCIQCSVSLTYHQKKNRLQCHYCGYRERVPTHCVKCNAESAWVPIGAGTESLEADLHKINPALKIARLDREALSTHKKLTETIARFRKGEIQIIIGTQMIVKGHDFPQVTLVIVAQADALIRSPDFRAEEKALQTLIQVAGRAGRGNKKGKVIIQSFDPSHRAFVAFAKNSLADTEAFFSEIKHERREMGYPPFVRMAKLRTESKTVDDAKNFSEHLKQVILEKDASHALQILGPAPSLIERLRNDYRTELLVKSAKIEWLHAAVDRAINEAGKFKKRLVVDIDPYGLN